MALNPGGIIELMQYANSLTFAGRPEEAIPLFQKAIRLNPLRSSVLHREFGRTLRDSGRFEEAVSEFKKRIQLQPDDINAHAHLAITYSVMGREKEASAEGAEVLRRNPNFSWAGYNAYKDQSQNDKIVNALRKAGLK